MLNIIEKINVFLCVTKKSISHLISLACFHVSIQRLLPLVRLATLGTREYFFTVDSSHVVGKEPP